MLILAWKVYQCESNENGIETSLRPFLEEYRRPLEWLSKKSKKKIPENVCGITKISPLMFNSWLKKEETLNSIVMLMIEWVNDLLTSIVCVCIDMCLRMIFTFIEGCCYSGSTVIHVYTCVWHTKISGIETPCSDDARRNDKIFWQSFTNYDVNRHISGPYRTWWANLKQNRQQVFHNNHISNFCEF